MEKKNLLFFSKIKHFDFRALMYLTFKIMLLKYNSVKMNFDLKMLHKWTKYSNSSECLLNVTNLTI